MTLSAYLRAKRENGMSQKDLATQLQIAQSSVSSYINTDEDRAVVPNYDIAKKVYLMDSIAIYPYCEQYLKEDLGV